MTGAPLPARWLHGRRSSSCVGFRFRRPRSSRCRRRRATEPAAGAASERHASGSSSTAVVTDDRQQRLLKPQLQVQGAGACRCRSGSSGCRGEGVKVPSQASHKPLQERELRTCGHALDGQRAWPSTAREPLRQRQLLTSRCLCVAVPSAGIVAGIRSLQSRLPWGVMCGRPQEVVVRCMCVLWHC